MRALRLKNHQPINEAPLVEEKVPMLEPGDHQLLVRVYSCGICHTDLHRFKDGKLEHASAYLGCTAHVDIAPTAIEVKKTSVPMQNLLDFIEMVALLNMCCPMLNSHF